MQSGPEPSVSEKDLFGPVGTWLSRSVETLPCGKERTPDATTKGRLELSRPAPKARMAPDSVSARILRKLWTIPPFRTPANSRRRVGKLMFDNPWMKARWITPSELGGALAQQGMVMKPAHARLGA